MLPVAPDPGWCSTAGGLPGLLGVLQLLAEELGEGFQALMGARNEQRVAALQPVGVAGPVGPASAPVHGEGVHPGLGFDLEGAERLAVRRRPWGDGELEDDFVRLADGCREHRMDLLAFLDDPDHLHGAVCDGLRGGGEVKEAPEARGVLHTGGGEKDPALQPVAHLVHLVLDGDNLAGEPRVAVEQGRVREPDCHLREVLHLYQDIHRAVDLRELASGWLRLRRVSERTGASEFPDLGDALRRALQEQYVAGPKDVFGLGIERPDIFGAEGDGAHPRLHGQVNVAQRAAVKGAIWVHADTGGYLFGLRYILQKLRRDPKTLDHDLGYIDGGVADLLYVLDDLEDSRHLFGVRGASRGQDGQGTHVEDQVVEALLEVGYLFRKILGVVEDRRVGEVDHKLRGVLRLDEHLLHIPWSRLAHLLPRQSENDKGYYKAHKAEQVHRRRDYRDAVGVWVQPEPVAEGRAVVGREDRRRGGDQTSKSADPDHRQEAWTDTLFEKCHGYEVRSPPDEHVDTGGENVGEREVSQGRELWYPTWRYETEMDLGGEAAGEDAAEGAALLQEGGQKDAQGQKRSKLFLPMLQRHADQNGHCPRQGQDRERFSQDTPQVLDAYPEAEVCRGHRGQNQRDAEGRREDGDADKVGSQDERGEGEDIPGSGEHRGCDVIHIPAAGDREAGDEDRDPEQQHAGDDTAGRGYDDIIDDRELRSNAENAAQDSRQKSEEHPGDERENGCGLYVLGEHAAPEVEPE